MSTGETDLPATDATRRPPLVVLADDTAALRLLLRRVLEMQGCKVETYPDGDQALAACLSLKPDLVITDVNMPELHGTALLRSLRAAGDLTPVLVMSSYFDDVVLAACARHPNVSTLTKPFGLSDFTSAVQSLLRKPAEC